MELPDFLKIPDTRYFFFPIDTVFPTASSGVWNNSAAAPSQSTATFSFASESSADQYSPYWIASLEMSWNHSPTQRTVRDAGSDSPDESSFPWRMADADDTLGDSANMASTSSPESFDFWEGVVTGLTSTEVTAKLAYCSSMAFWAQSPMATTSTMVETPIITPNALKEVRSLLL